jgi:hypothetical protein
MAIPVFFTCKWLLKKWIKKERTRKIATWVATLVVTPIIYTGLIVLLIYWISYTPSKDFTQQEWLTNKEERYQMADDIIESKLLIGKDTNHVKLILGDTYWSDNYWRPDSINTWTYDMGIGGGLGFMFNHLYIKFEEDKVISVEHIKIPD